MILYLEAHLLSTPRNRVKNSGVTHWLWRVEEEEAGTVANSGHHYHYEHRTKFHFRPDLLLLSV